MSDNESMKKQIEYFSKQSKDKDDEVTKIQGEKDALLDKLKKFKEKVVEVEKSFDLKYGAKVKEMDLLQSQNKDLEDRVRKLQDEAKTANQDREKERADFRLKEEDLIQQKNEAENKLKEAMAQVQLKETVAREAMKVKLKFQKDH